MKLQDNKIEINIYPKIVINFELYIKEKYMQDNLQNQNIPPVQSQPIENPVEIKKKKWIKISLFVLIGVLVVAALATAGYVYFKAVKPSLTPIKESAKKEWVGAIETKKGLVKLSPQGILERDSSSKVKAVTPPWSKALDESIAIPRVLLQDGQIVFVGSPQIASALKENIIYSWNINSPQTSNPFFEIPEGQKIRSFAVSPDYKQIALISLTRTSDELYDGLQSLDLESSKKQLEEREKLLQEELRTVTVYNIKKGGVVKELKKKLLGSPSRRIGGGRLVWNETGLFVLDTPEITVYDPVSWQIKDIIPDTPTGSGGLHEQILISPDGSKYYNPTDSTLTIRKIPGGEIVGKVNAPEAISKEQLNETTDLENRFGWVGPSVFSQDSKKLSIQMRSVDQNNFMIRELDLESGKTEKIGDSEILKFGSIPISQIKSLFLFLTYSPSGDRIFFAANYPTGDKTGATDLFQLKEGEQKAEFIDLFDGLNIFFLGWYLSST